MLLFYAGHERYACGCEELFEVIPALEVSPALSSRSFLAGMLHYRVGPIAVVDFVELRTEIPCNRQYSARILIVCRGNEHVEWMGILVEKATSILDLEKEDFVKTPLLLQDEKYVVGIYADEEGVIRLIDMGLFLEEVTKKSKEKRP